MTVTSGFYVRSLCHDLGEMLGCGAMMAELSRTRQGQFVLGGDNCIEYDELHQGESVWGPKLHRMLDLWNNPNAEQAKPKASEPASSPAQGNEASKPATKDPQEKPVDESKPAEDAKPTETAPEPEPASDGSVKVEQEQAAAASA
jgi:tRNA pseudouridine55 synthase